MKLEICTHQYTVGFGSKGKPEPHKCFHVRRKGKDSPIFIEYSRRRSEWIVWSACSPRIRRTEAFQEAIETAGNILEEF